MQDDKKCKRDLVWWKLNNRLCYGVRRPALRSAFDELRKCRVCACINERTRCDLCQVQKVISIGEIIKSTSRGGQLFA